MVAVSLESGSSIYNLFSNYLGVNEKGEATLYLGRQLKMQKIMRLPVKDENGNYIEEVTTDCQKCLQLQSITRLAISCLMFIPFGTNFVWKA